jgi:hypothetical protein
MSIQERSPMNRNSITVVVVLLCAAGYAYSQGWFDLSRPSAEIESNKVSTEQAVEQQSTNRNAADATEPVPEAKE